MKKILLTLGVLALSLPVAQAQYDDIYYNPDKPSASRTTQTQKQKKQKKSYYIADFSNMDVDEYNRAGDMYYATPVDTIGTTVENGQDFVYTQQIQKYYNPTIVLDNADLLEDVLNNSYGNVEVVINNNGIPVFSPYYSSVYYNYPFYASWNWGPSWTWTWGPSWSWNWGWGPSWAWGPSWTWGPSWSWGWGPGYYPGWGPAWGPAYPPGGWHRPFYAEYRPGAHRPTAPRPGWSSNRPRGGNYHGQVAGRPTRGDRYNTPGSGSLTHNRQYAGNRRGYNDASSTVSSSRDRLSTNRSQRVDRNKYSTSQIDGTSQSQGTTPNRNYGTSTNRSNRSYNSGSSTTNTNRSSYNTNRNSYNNTNRNSYNTNTNRNSYNRSNSSSYNRSSSYGSSSRSYGGGSRSYGGGGGRSGGGHRR